MDEQSEESKLTDRYQTTVPEAVRKALKLGKRDRIRYKVQANGTVLMSRAPDSEDDPVIGAFLSFVARDLKTHPERIEAVSPSFVSHMRGLVRNVKIDLGVSLSEDDE